jgi:eukaryotic-like serine/threonine-protein kinase
MTRDRWQQVHALLADVIECAPAGRPALLDARCGGDASLREEVESLLAAHESDGLVDQLAPIVKPPAAWWQGIADPSSRRRVAHYAVQETLGAGGMGVVCKALDARLGRHAHALPRHGRIVDRARRSCGSRSSWTPPPWS